MKIQRTLSCLKKRPGLAVLILILIIITLANIKPDFYLLGWDNYSSYFNLKTNLFRTLFSSWREYRGLGVPSDSEVVDIFRQIFFLVLSPFVRETLLEQIYFLFCLSVGVLGMYFFARKLFQYVFSKKGTKYLDLVAFIAAFFYLFNLGTLATFYFPMIMYINRYASLPILFLIFLKLKEEKKVSLNTFILIVFSLLFLSGSFLTATIFLTFLAAIITYGLFLGDYKKQIFFVLFFIGINLFWLLPFVNHALEKSEIIKLAPTFISANENQLNKGTSFYSVDRLLLLYTSFFDTEIAEIDSGKSHPLHPKINFFKQILPKSVLFIFPFLYLSGIALILIKYRKKSFFWIPIVIILSLLLVGKEYTPFGFIYNFIEYLIPYFKILFRFADTKFNIFISFGGSLAAGLFFIYLFGLIDKRFKKIKRIVKVIIFIPLFLTIILFSSYFKGDLIAPFMYNKIPPLYFQLAEIINKDKGNFRVLHLPFSRNSYWKSHVWGMIGSSWLNFVLDKPLIDRTFEPASMENVYLHQAIFQIIDNAQEIEDEQALEKRSAQLYRLLRKVGVKYILWDETVSPSVYSRGVNFWEKFNTADAKTIVEVLKKLALIETVAEQQLNVLDYLDLYPERYPLTQDTTNHLKKNPYYSVQLLKIKEPMPKLYFSQKKELLDPGLNDLLKTDLVFGEENYLQDSNEPPTYLFPFQRQNVPLSKDNNELIFNLENPFKNSAEFLLELKDNNLLQKRYFLEIFAKVDSENLVLSFDHLPLPIIQGQKIKENLGEIKIPLVKVSPYLSQTSDSLDNFFSDWHILDGKEISSLRLNINDLIIPLPSKLNSEMQSIGTVAVSEGKLEIKILAKEESASLNLEDFQLTEDPNCFKDKVEDYDFKLNKTDNRLILHSQNGSTCFFRNFGQEVGEEVEYVEVKFDIEAKSKDLENVYSQNLDQSSKPALKSKILKAAKPNLLRVCLKETALDECLNKHQILNLKDKQIVIVPFEKSFKDIYSPSILLTAKKTTFQRQELTFNSITLDQFKAVEKAELKVKPSSSAWRIHLDSKKDITLEIPKSLSPYSYYFDKEKDGFYLSNKPCGDGDNSYRTFRIINDNLISYFENCFNVVFIQNKFDSRNFYLWNIDYNLLSGKYPQYVLDDGFHFYKKEYLSLNQGYPDIPFFKTLQKPERILSKLFKASYQKSLDEKFANLEFQKAFTYIYSQPELNDQRYKDFTLQQDSENEGVLALNSFDVLELPNDWQNLNIKRPDSLLTFDLPEKVEFEQILPSLWKIKLSEVTPPRLAKPSSDGGTKLLVFNEGYDRQWQIYENFLSLLLGKKAKNVNHLKFSGFANAWEIENPKTQSFYIFYAPEKLAWLGWFLILAVILLGGWFLQKRTFSEVAPLSGDSSDGSERQIVV